MRRIVVQDMIFHRTMLAVCIFSILLGTGSCAVRAADPADYDADALPAVTSVLKSDESPTGYYATFTYRNPEAVSVKIRGEWYFSDERNSSIYTSQKVSPWEYVEGMFPLQDETGEWMISDMVPETGTGLWRFTIPLPGGVWSYRFLVNTAAGYFEVSDINNPPVERSLGQQTNSQVFVPCAQEGGDLDIRLQFPREDGHCGVMETIFYDASGIKYALLDEPAVAVYLPYGYDPEREEPYKVLYALHGSGIESETSWWNKGVLGNLMDNLAADYNIDPFVVVMPNNYSDSFDYHNIIDRIIPLAEERYNIRRDSAGRGICGISLGAIMAKNILLNSPESFLYYGIFSGAYFSDSPEIFNSNRIAPCHIYIAAGEREIGLLAAFRTAQKLAAAGKTDFHFFTVMGGHNWYVWRRIYVDFVLHELWQ